MKYVENGEKVTAGQEVVKDVITRIDGIVELKIENDIIHEVIIRPGEVYDLENPDDLTIEDESIVQAGTEIIPNVKADRKSLISLMADEETGEVKIFVRPIQEFKIEPHNVTLKTDASDDFIKIVPVTQILYKNGDRVRNLEGGQLTRTSLMLEMADDLKLLKGHLEYKGANKLAIMVQDTILLRRESESSTTYLLVNEGSVVKNGDAIAKTQVLANSPGEIRLSLNDERKLLLITKDHLYLESCKPNSKFAAGEYLKKGDFLDEDRSIQAEYSGQIVALQDNTIIILRGRPYLISANTQLQVESGSLVQRGDQLATLIFEQQKTGDIVQGLPRVEELLEGRKPKESAVLSPMAGKVKIETLGSGIGDYKLVVIGENGRIEVEIPPGQNLLVDDGQEVAFGEPLTDGVINPHQVLEVLGQEVVQLHLINEVQQVYCSQGVEISDKHIEVIVRQMTMKVKVEDPGDTIFLPGELIELAELQRANEKVKEENGEEATYKHVLLGITKASLNTKSFISAASFQETTRILAESSLEGKSDELRGLKENVIVGKLIPAGTGYATKLRRQKERENNFVEANVQAYTYSQS